jgi:hypothetical protein
MRAASVNAVARWAAAALCASGCSTYYDPCFAPQGQVRDLRVLAVRADPPEALADLEGGFVERVEMKVLFGSIDDLHLPVAVTAQLCMPTDDLQCPPDALVVARGSAYPIASFHVDAPADLLTAALAADKLHGYGGIRLQLDVTAPADPGGAPVHASKLLIYTPPAPGRTPNHGLEVPALRVLRDDGSVGELRNAEMLGVDVSSTVGLRPLLAPGPGGTDAVEQYTVVDLTGRTVVLREHVTYTFYVTPHNYFGEFVNGVATFRSDANKNGDVADEPAPGTPDPPRGLVRLTPVNASAGRLWVVARDGRGGEAFLSLPLTTNDTRGGRKAALEVECQ